MLFYNPEIEHDRVQHHFCDVFLLRVLLERVQLRMNFHTMDRHKHTLVLHHPVGAVIREFSMLEVTYVRGGTVYMQN